MESAKSFIKRKTDKDLRRNKIIAFKAIEGGKKKNIWEIEKRIFMPQTDYGSKVFTFERLRFIKSKGKKTKRGKVNKIAYRIGYYIVGHKGNKKGKWTWGQYCPVIPQEDIRRLINLAKKEKVLI